ncbi:hypothetical protein M0813_20053 [Anaeramoeba flamelloides]|uniref:Uncharacterized protein n=1 Tax=Anaeramoeba flamelloides TaxID=1746091 RepID=A0ABQ8YM06_9EUKA|nr:hypothetical protein M0813_20053 [Anaeramoeba flamelloides]
MSKKTKNSFVYLISITHPPLSNKVYIKQISDEYLQSEYGVRVQNMVCVDLELIKNANYQHKAINISQPNSKKKLRHKSKYLINYQYLQFPIKLIQNTENGLSSISLSDKSLHVFDKYMRKIKKLDVLMNSKNLIFQYLNQQISVDCYFTVKALRNFLFSFFKIQPDFIQVNENILPYPILFLLNFR